MSRMVVVNSLALGRGRRTFADAAMRLPTTTGVMIATYRPVEGSSR